MTNERAHKWKIGKRGRVGNICHVCKKEKDTWEHMTYDCSGIQEWIRKIEASYIKYKGQKDRKPWNTNEKRVGFKTRDRDRTG